MKYYDTPGVANCLLGSSLSQELKLFGLMFALMKSLPVPENRLPRQEPNYKDGMVELNRFDKISEPGCYKDMLHDLLLKMESTYRLEISGHSLTMQELATWMILVMMRQWKERASADLQGFAQDVGVKHLETLGLVIANHAHEHEGTYLSTYVAYVFSLYTPREVSREVSEEDRKFESHVLALISDVLLGPKPSYKITGSSVLRAFRGDFSRKQAALVEQTVQIFAAKLRGKIQAVVSAHAGPGTDLDTKQRYAAECTFDCLHMIHCTSEVSLTLCRQFVMAILKDTSIVQSIPIYDYQLGEVLFACLWWGLTAEYRIRTLKYPEFNDPDTIAELQEIARPGAFGPFLKGLTTADTPAKLLDKLSVISGVCSQNSQYVCHEFKAPHDLKSEAYTKFSALVLRVFQLVDGWPAIEEIARSEPAKFQAELLALGRNVILQNLVFVTWAGPANPFRTEWNMLNRVHTADARPPETMPETMPYDYGTYVTTGSYVSTYTTTAYEKLRMMNLTYSVSHPRQFFPVLTSVVYGKDTLLQRLQYFCPPNDYSHQLYNSCEVEDLPVNPYSPLAVKLESMHSPFGSHVTMTPTTSRVVEEEDEDVAVHAAYKEPKSKFVPMYINNKLNLAYATQETQSDSQEGGEEMEVTEELTQTSLATAKTTSTLQTIDNEGEEEEDVQTAATQVVEEPTEIEEEEDKASVHSAPKRSRDAQIDTATGYKKDEFLEEGGEEYIGSISEIIGGASKPIDEVARRDIQKAPATMLTAKRKKITPDPSGFSGGPVQKLTSSIATVATTEHLMESAGDALAEAEGKTENPAAEEEPKTAESLLAKRKEDAKQKRKEKTNTPTMWSIERWRSVLQIAATDLDGGQAGILNEQVIDSFHTHIVEKMRTIVQEAMTTVGLGQGAVVSIESIMKKNPDIAAIAKKNIENEWLLAWNMSTVYYANNHPNISKPAEIGVEDEAKLRKKMDLPVFYTKNYEEGAVKKGADMVNENREENREIEGELDIVDIVPFDKLVKGCEPVDRSLIRTLLTYLQLGNEDANYTDLVEFLWRQKTPAEKTLNKHLLVQLNDRQEAPTLKQLLKTITSGDEPMYGFTKDEYGIYIRAISECWNRKGYRHRTVPTLDEIWEMVYEICQDSTGVADEMARKEQAWTEEEEREQKRLEAEGLQEDEEAEEEEEEEEEDTRSTVTVYTPEQIRKQNVEAVGLLLRMHHAIGTRFKQGYTRRTIRETRMWTKDEMEVLVPGIPYIEEEEEV